MIVKLHLRQPAWTCLPQPSGCAEVARRKVSPSWPKAERGDGGQPPERDTRVREQRNVKRRPYSKKGHDFVPATATATAATGSDRSLCGPVAVSAIFAEVYFLNVFTSRANPNPEGKRRIRHPKPLYHPVLSWKENSEKLRGASTQPNDDFHEAAGTTAGETSEATRLGILSLWCLRAPQPANHVRRSVISSSSTLAGV